MFESLFNKVAGRQERELQHRCFPVKFAKFLRKPISKNICKQLLLEISEDFLKEHLQMAVVRL